MGEDWPVAFLKLATLIVANDYIQIISNDWLPCENKSEIL